MAMHEMTLSVEELLLVRTALETLASAIATMRGMGIDVPSSTSAQILALQERMTLAGYGH
jgi:hypothetical protein